MWEKQKMLVTSISYFSRSIFYKCLFRVTQVGIMWSRFNRVISPILAKPKGTLGLHSVHLSVPPSVRQSIRLSVHSITFPEFFLKRLQILTWFLVWKSITMTYRSSLSFVTLHWLLWKLQALDLVNLNDQTVFWTFFLNACRYWPDFWHVSQSPWLTDQIQVSFCSIDFWRNYRPWTK